MTADELRTELLRWGVAFSEKREQYATHFECKAGEIFRAYDSGKLVCQGKNTLLARKIKAMHDGGVAVTVEAPAAVQAAGPPIFIVYGHDTGTRDQLELVLRRMGFTPIILGNLPAAGDTIIEKLERYIGEHGDVGFACVLLTPDDEGHEVGKPEEKKYRARQNVILELGMVLAKVGRRRVAILHKSSVELPSDMNGLIYIPFQERIEEVRNQLFKELRGAGYNPHADGLN
jgi:predicted nucleotide-binding protein